MWEATRGRPKSEKDAEEWKTYVAAICLHERGATAVLGYHACVQVDVPAQGGGR